MKQRAIDTDKDYRGELIASYTTPYEGNHTIVYTERHYKCDCCGGSGVVSIPMLDLCEADNVECFQCSNMEFCKENKLTDKAYTEKIVEIPCPICEGDGEIYTIGR